MVLEREAVARVTGRTQYTGDLVVPGMIRGKVLRSPYAHARVLRIDATKAEAIPGVWAVLTREDLKGIKPYYGPAFVDQPILAMEKVRYAGEPVAAVAATDEAVALEALAGIDVEYEPLPVASNLDRALAPGAPLVHEEVLERAGNYPDLMALHPIAGTNICHYGTSEIGEVERGMAAADYVFESTFSCPSVNHYPLEPLATVADYQGDYLRVWSSSQTPFHVRNELARMFGLPLSRVRVIVPPVGGGFGAKCYTRIEPLTAALSMKAQRPVQLLLDANETFQSVCRCAFRGHIRSGVKGDGTLVAWDVEFYLDCGAYAVNGPRLSSSDPPLWFIPYRVPHVRVKSYAVYTNTVPNAVLRGAPGPHAGWARESQMDIIARELGMDPVGLRMKNALEPDEVFSPDWTPLYFDFRAALRQVDQALRRTSPEEAGQGEGGKRRGRGVACIAKGYRNVGGPLPPRSSLSSVSLRLGVDGSLQINTSAVDMGQGVHTVLARIAAEQLGIPLEQITVANPDSEVTPFEHPTSASRSTMNVGRAVEHAARELRARLVTTASQMLEVEPDSVEFRDGFVYGDGRRLPLVEVVARQPGVAPGGGEMVAHAVDPGAQSGSAAEVGVEGAEVEVDEETGEVGVLRFVSAIGVGRAINKGKSHGQNEGGAMYTLGHALMEEMVYDDDGQLTNSILTDYVVPSFRTMPEEFESILVEDKRGPGPGGARGIGETGGVSVMPAIANAVHDAIGVRFTEMPLTPQRIVGRKGQRPPHGTADAGVKRHGP